MSRAKCIMVQGTMSGAGKSLLCAALCRIFAQDGLRAVPFKSQNMALNSFVTKDGLEMGRAQVVQAQAAGVEPDVRMNPILLKPSSDVGSQVIVNGEVRGQMKASEYFRTKRQLVPDILKAYDSLAEEADVIVIEGAGSPAEINLKSEDIVNMGLAEMVDADILLILTKDENLWLNYETEKAVALHEVTVDEVKKMIADNEFPKASKLPKVQAAVDFIEEKKGSGRKAVITDLAHAMDALTGKTGTIITE